MNNFYRFLRPQQFNVQRNAIEAMPHGGVCILARPMNLLPDDKRLFLGLSICQTTDMFNRTVAKRKAENPDWYVNPKSFSTEDIIDELLENPREATRVLAPELDPEEYLWDQLREFKITVEWIRETRKQARKFQQNHHDAVKALQLGERYNELQS